MEENLIKTKVYVRSEDILSIEDNIKRIKTDKELFSFLLHKELSMNKFRSPSQIKVELISAFDLLEEFGFDTLSFLIKNKRSNSNPFYFLDLTVYDLYSDETLRKNRLLKVKNFDGSTEFLPLKAPVKLLLDKLKLS